MKTNIFSRKSPTALGLGLALLVGGFGMAQAQPSPVGTWDCALSSPWKGTAYITFGTNFTVSGIQIMTPPHTATNSYDLDRHTNVFGGAFITGGEWHFQNDKVVGFYTAEGRTSGGPCTTNENLSYVNEETTIQRTNDDGSITFITTNIVTVITNTPTITCPDNVTNSSRVSFEATVKPGKRIYIHATIEDGRSTSLKGVPATLLPDISGFYYGSGRNNRAPFNEFFTLTLMDPSVNAYGLAVQGPGYTLSGIALLSAKSISFYSDDGPSNSVLRALSGSIKIAKGNAMLKGFQSDGEDNETDKITYKVTKQPNPPPPPPPPAE